MFLKWFWPVARCDGRPTCMRSELSVSDRKAQLVRITNCLSACSFLCLNYNIDDDSSLQEQHAGINVMKPRAKYSHYTVCRISLSHQLTCTAHTSLHSIIRRLISSWLKNAITTKRQTFSSLTHSFLLLLVFVFFNGASLYQCIYKQVINRHRRSAQTGISIAYCSFISRSC